LAKHVRSKRCSWGKLGNPRFKPRTGSSD